jgi:tetraacyldisaccharide 4'-kinase
MRRQLEEPIRRHWYGNNGLGNLFLGALTGPASVLFGLGVRTRNVLYDQGLLHSADPSLPVISVGNLAVGGTGKTPVARWLMDRLLQLDRTPALVSRGYGHDEVLLHRRWHPGCPVIADPDRLRGVAKAAREGADTCILDDGFQHRRMDRDLDILLFSHRDPLPARLLPRGPYREPLRSLRRSQLVLVTSHGQTGRRRVHQMIRQLGALPGSPAVVAFPFRPGPWQELDGSIARRPEAGAVVVSSVARPKSVAALAEEAGVQVAEVMAYPDHHNYSEDDVTRIRNQAGSRPMVTTEKDAVKLVHFRDHLPDVRVLTLAPDPDPGVVRIIDKALETALAKGDARVANEPAQGREESA